MKQVLHAEMQKQLEGKKKKGNKQNTTKNSTYFFPIRASSLPALEHISGTSQPVFVFITTEPCHII